MLVFETIAVAFAMFSAIPVPQPVWNDRNMRYALCAFPLVGVVLGLLWWCWGALCGVLDLPELLRAAGFCLLPPVLLCVPGGLFFVCPLFPLFVLHTFCVAVRK